MVFLRSRSFFSCASNTVNMVDHCSFVIVFVPAISLSFDIVESLFGLDFDHIFLYLYCKSALNGLRLLVLRLPEGLNVVVCNFCNMQAVMDADALIKIAKVSLKELIVSNISVHIPNAVKEESVDEGKARGYPDALLIEKNLQAGKISVVKTKRNKTDESITKDLQLTGGEADSLNLFHQGEYDTIVSDDQRFLELVDSLGIPFLTPAALLFHLYKQGIISGADARRYMEKLRPMISNEEYFATTDMLE